MPSNKYLKLTARLDINSQMNVFGGFANKNWKAAAETLREIGRLAYEYAKENVTPGNGPGPHPHIWPHEDTEELLKSVGLKFDYSGGSRLAAYVYTEKEYGTYLEVGWKTPRGRFIRYPWLKPAYKKAGLAFGNLFQKNWKREVSNIETGKQVMSSGEIDAYGSEVLELLKPINGWKDPVKSGLPPEFISILTAAEVEPEQAGVKTKKRLIHLSDKQQNALKILSSREGKERQAKKRDSRRLNRQPLSNQPEPAPARRRTSKPKQTIPQSLADLNKAYEKSKAEIREQRDQRRRDKKK